MPGFLDALDYAGSLQEKLGGRAIRGALGGHPRELLSPIPFSDTLGITDPSERVTGHDLAKQWGLASPEHPWAHALTGFGIDVATDPLTWGGGALAKGLGLAGKTGEAASEASKIPMLRSLGEQIPYEGPMSREMAAIWDKLPPAPPPGDFTPWDEMSRFSRLKSLREPTTMAKGMGTPAERLVGGRAEREALAGDMPYADPLLRSRIADVHTMQKAYDLYHEANQGVPQGMTAMGVVVPPWSPGNFAGMSYALDRPTARHELMHALTTNAAYSGRGIEELPLFSRLAAKQYQAGNFQHPGFRQGLGVILDELGAHATDVSKTKGYMRGGLEQVFSRDFHRGYHDQFSSASPLAAGLFHAAPGAVLGGTAGAVGGGVGGGMEGGPTGALEGALLGGMAGVAGGGALSHLLMSPALNRGAAAAPGTMRAISLLGQ